MGSIRKLSYIKGRVDMKKFIVFIMTLLCICGLSGCNGNAPVSTTEVEKVSSDYGKVIDLAKAEFAEVFKEFDELKIEETATMTRTDDAKEIVVQIRYSSSNGNGIYGFMYNLDDYSNPELIQQGEDITIDKLLE